MQSLLTLNELYESKTKYLVNERGNIKFFLNSNVPNLAGFWSEQINRRCQIYIPINEVNHDSFIDVVILKIFHGVLPDFINCMVKKEAFEVEEVWIFVHLYTVLFVDSTVSR